MASPLSIPSLQDPLLHKPKFLGQNLFPISVPRHPRSVHLRASAKFNLSELLGGRGICNGEKGIEQELNRDAAQPPQTPPPVVDRSEPSAVEGVADDVFEKELLADDAFEKELLGLTGGFPGGEMGLQKFLEKNPPPEKTEKSGSDQKGSWVPSSAKKAKAPELPLLLPGMIVIVKNPKNPFYMYCGIVQRITDGKAGVLFEGGNWDRLITFSLEELERREKGPPMVNPKSAVLEELIEQET